MSWAMTGEEYNTLTEHAEVVKRHRSGVKVWRLPDNRILKLFRPKWGFSRERIFPSSFRFARNARRLNRLGFRSVEVERVFYCASIKRQGVLYRLLPGESLDILLSETGNGGLLAELAVFAARLHDAGVLFRSLHPGNVVRLPDETLGLIDVQEVTIHRGPLRLRARLRNFRHLLRNSEYRQMVVDYGLEKFLDDYLHSAHMADADQTKLKAGVLALDLIP